MWFSHSIETIYNLFLLLYITPSQECKIQS